MTKRRFFPNLSLGEDYWIGLEKIANKGTSIKIDVPIKSGSYEVVGIALPSFAALMMNESNQYYHRATSIVEKITFKRVSQKTKIVEGITEEELMDYFAFLSAAIIFTVTALESDINQIVDKLDFPIDLPKKLKDKELVSLSEDDFLWQSIEYKIKILSGLYNLSQKKIVLHEQNQAFTRIHNLLKLRNVIIHSKQKKYT